MSGCNTFASLIVSQLALCLYGSGRGQPLKSKIGEHALLAEGNQNLADQNLPLTGPAKSIGQDTLILRCT